LPLEGNILIDEFKVYMNDIGLLVSMLEEGSVNDILNDNLKIYKGAIFENLVADILTKKNIRLYYFQKTQYSNDKSTELKSFEIDFILREKNSDKIKLLEVKAKNGTCKSLSYVNKKYPNTLAIKLTTKFLQDYEDIKCYPLYLLFFIL
jgi:predicted AAA+ superfamily ATPase